MDSARPELASDICPRVHCAVQEDACFPRADSRIGARQGHQVRRTAGQGEQGERLDVVARLSE